MKIYDAPHNFARVEEHDICPTLIARAGTGGGNVPLVLGSSQPNAAILDDDTCPTLTAQMGTGGNNMPLVLMNPSEFATFAESETSGTITTQIGKGVTGSQPLVLMDQGGGVMTVEHDKVGTLRAQTHGHEPVILQEVYPINMANALRKSSDGAGGIGVGAEGEPMFTLTTTSEKRAVAIIEQEAYRISSDASNCMRSGNPHSGINKVDLAPTVDTTDPSPSKGQGGIAIVTFGALPHVFKLRSGCNGGGKGYLGQDDKSFTLATNNDQYLMTNEPIPINTQAIASRQGDVANRVGLGVGKEGDPANTLGANHCHGVFDMQARVRKLTPTECERLQGFPDNWTRIPYRGKDEENCPDSPRYKAIGNSWCVPCVRWIGERIKAELKKGNNE